VRKQKLLDPWHWKAKKFEFEHMQSANRHLWFMILKSIIKPLIISQSTMGFINSGLYNNIWCSDNDPWLMLHWQCIGRVESQSKTMWPKWLLYEVLELRYMVRQDVGTKHHSKGGKLWGRDATTMRYTRDKALLWKHGHEVDEPQPNVLPLEGKHKMTHHCKKAQMQI
jgi:hypothetical protein